MYPDEESETRLKSKYFLPLFDVHIHYERPYKIPGNIIKSYEKEMLQDNSNISSQEDIEKKYYGFLFKEIDASGKSGYDIDTTAFYIKTDGNPIANQLYLPLKNRKVEKLPFYPKSGKGGAAKKQAKKTVDKILEFGVFAGEEEVEIKGLFERLDREFLDVKQKQWSQAKSILVELTVALENKYGVYKKDNKNTGVKSKE